MHHIRLSQEEERVGGFRTCSLDLFGPSQLHSVFLHQGLPM